MQIPRPWPGPLPPDLWVRPGNPGFKQDVQVMLTHRRSGTPALHCETQAARDRTFYLCDPRASLSVWDIRRQSTVCRRSEGVPPYRGNGESQKARNELPAPQTPSSSALIFGVSVPPLDFIYLTISVTSGWGERRWFVCNFTKQIPKSVSFSIKRAPNHHHVESRGPRNLAAGSVLGRHWYEAVPVLRTLSVRMGVIWGEKVQSKESKDGHRFLCRVREMF